MSRSRSIRGALPASRTVLIAAALGLAACADQQPVGPVGPAARSVTASQAVEARGNPIPDQYIVVFKPGVADPRGLARGLAQAQGGTVLRTYEHAIKGFAVRLPARAAEALRRNPNVQFVEQDATVEPSATQLGATWGIDRIDQRDLPLSTTYTDAVDGSGVTVYIIDSGIRLTHAEFGGRATSGIDLIDGSGEDCRGHGTHVAGTVGGSTYGVAKGVNLVSVRVFDCSGPSSWSIVIAAVDWVTANHAPRSVANMSLGGGLTRALNAAVTGSIDAGVVYVAAAGNDDAADACSVSPASTPGAITVAASTKLDARSDFSNVGTCVDLFAPGSAITSAWPWDDAATRTIQGTSMAAPHVAGAAALYRQRFPGATPAQVAAALTANATADKITDARAGTPNLLLYTGFITTGTPQTIVVTSTPPAPAFVGDSYTLGATTVSGLTVTFTSRTPLICTVSGATASFVAAGTCTLAADQAGNATYLAAAQATQSMTIVRRPQTITVTSVLPASAVVTRTFPLAATGGGSGQPVVFTTQTPRTCTTTGVNGTTLTLTADGACSVAVTQAGTAAYDPAPAQTLSLTVLTPAQATTALRDLVAAGTLTPDLGRALTAKLDDALKALVAGKTKAACGALADFASQLQAQGGKAIPELTADAWLAETAAIRKAAGC